MERFTARYADHTKIDKGMYIAKIDGDITVYDLRFCRPNGTRFLTRAEEHTLAHLYESLFADMRDDSFLWFAASPSGSGFYLVMRGAAHSKAIKAVADATEKIACWEGKIPCVSAEECSDIESHDIEGAKKWAQVFLPKVRNLTQDMLEYPA